MKVPGLYDGSRIDTGYNKPEDHPESPGTYHTYSLKGKNMTLEVNLMEASAVDAGAVLAYLAEVETDE